MVIFIYLERLSEIVEIVKNKLFDLVSESSLGIESLIIGAATFERSYRLDHDTHAHLVQL